MDSYDPKMVLAELEKERAQLDAAIAYFRHKAGLGPEDPGVDGAGKSTRTKSDIKPDTTIREDTFFGMSTPDAVKKFLAMAKRPSRAKDISVILLAGGLITRSKNFYTTLYTTMRRMEKAGDLVKVDGKWALAAWYPSPPKPKAKGEQAGNGDADAEKGEGEEAA